MKYVEQTIPVSFMQEFNLKPITKNTLYWVCGNSFDVSSFFDADELYPISKSDAYIKVVTYLKHIIREQKKILISGDFDCDGICATTLLYSGLMKLGLVTGYYIPNRQKDGYGLSTKLVELYHSKGYEVIICVDNGVIAHDAIARAYELGMEVVVLDHHEMDERTSNYEYVLHPLLMEEEFHYLCGTGVVLEVLRSLLEIDSYMLTLGALAAISDMMILWGENRRVVRLGIKAMAEDRGTPLWHLLDSEDLDEGVLALKLAPKINAVGRMYEKANPNQLVKYLLCDDVSAVSKTAVQISALNEDRKALSKEILALAQAQIDTSLPYLMAVGVFHEGIVGLVASSLVHEYHRPVFVLSSDNGILKGSCRSVSSIDLVDMLRNCPYLEVFGGHKAAGGLSLKEENFELFKNYVEEYMNTHEMSEECVSYIPLSIDEFSLDEIEEIYALRPFLRVQEEPLYRFNGLKLSEARFMSEGKHARWNLSNGSEIVFFQIPEEIKKCDYLDVIGTLKVSTYRGKRKAILTVKECI